MQKLTLNRLAPPSLKESWVQHPRQANSLAQVVPINSLAQVVPVNSLAQVVPVNSLAQVVPVSAPLP